MYTSIKIGGFSLGLVTCILIALFIRHELSYDSHYKITITWDVFLLAGIMSVVIALVTISYQSLRAALANPATNLRSE